MTATAPKTTIVCKRVADLTACEYAQCRRLTFPEDEGTMLDCLRYARQYERGRTLFPRGWLPAQTLLLYDGTRLLGWCLLDHHRSSMVYVRRCARRQGLGTHLMAELLRRHPQAQVHPHDEISRAFFHHLERELGTALTVGYGYLPLGYDEDAL